MVGRPVSKLDAGMFATSISIVILWLLLKEALTYELSEKLRYALRVSKASLTGLLVGCLINNLLRVFEYLVDR